ncbi:MAG: hypothetical protein A3F83_05500 [Candidatus Glassbacteria bacterium RIFCSPLOWO2_12_FULL_58_11]|uniref:Helix-turn-helix domain-containing protein n=1 Tax=Candidatus Glassbacteria bacterium RIFCSPLOWO2_12_FULL_58_11 TaxID=1817867 RepID=A0A1F5YSD5_9BACT|nr:MAG: hypothetical protein A3F83_05500 [Candidatus Glassbacteria bacterium RIFCSPLOWO2_12_FULL_58_11]
MIAEEKGLSGRVLSVNSAARYTGYSRAVVEYWLNDGLLPFEEVPTPGTKNRCRRIRRADLDQFLEVHLKRNSNPGNPAGRERKDFLILLDR